MKISLCEPNGNQFCPVLDIQTDRVLIGEEENQVVLTIPEWNRLKSLVKRM